MTQPVINVTQPADADERMYAMMWHLIVAYGLRQAPESPASREVVQRQDALDAVILLAAVLDEEAEAGHIPAGRAMHAAAMLMVIREFIQPLPAARDEDGSADQVTADLGMMVMALREARQATGHQG